MQAPDYLVLTFYLFGMLALGGYYALKNANLSDMFAAGGQSPWWVSGLSGFMTMFSAGTFVVWGGIAYKLGAVAIAINVCYGLAALIAGYWVAGRWKEMGLRTPAQFIELRFGRAAVVLYTVVLLLYRIIGAGIALYALAVLVAALIPLEAGHVLRDPTTGKLSVLWATIIFGTIVVAYTMAGGLWAVLMTDVLQFIILNIAVIFLVPLMIGHAGGINEVLIALPDNFFAPTADNYTFYFLAGWVAIHVFIIGAEWAFVQRFISVPSSNDARKSAYLFGALYLISPVIWLAPPIIYRAINPGVDPEQAYILAAQAVLPAGMVGLMVAAMFSATASLVSSQLNVFSGVLTDPIARRVKLRSERGALWIGRACTVVLGAFLVGFAVLVPFIGGAEKVIVSVTSLVAGPLLAPSLWALFDRTIGAKSVWASVIISGAFGACVKFGLAENGFLDGIAALNSVQDWFLNNSAQTDLIIGVVVPIITMVGMQYLSKDISIGTKRLEVYKKSVAKSQPSTTANSAGAAMVVAVAIGLSAIVMGLLAATSHPDDSSSLSMFALVLLAIAMSIFAFQARSRSKLTK